MHGAFIIKSTHTQKNTPVLKMIGILPEYQASSFCLVPTSWAYTEEKKKKFEITLASSGVLEVTFCCPMCSTSPKNGTYGDLAWFENSEGL